MPSIILNILSIVIIFASIIGMFFAITLLRKGNGALILRSIFSFILFVVSLQLIEVDLMLNGLTYLVPWIDGITFPLIYGIAPLYYIYIRMSINPNYRPQYWYYIFFLPVIYLTYDIWDYLFMDQQMKAEYLKKTYNHEFVINVLEMNLVAKAKFVFLSLQMATFFIFSYLKLKNHLKVFTDLESDNDIIERLNWLKTVTVFFGVYAFSYAAMLTALFSFNSYYIVIDLFWLTIVACFVISIAYYSVNIRDFSIKEVTEGQNDKYKTSSLDDIFAEKLYSETVNIIESERLFLNNQFRLSDLAERLNYSLHHISQVINKYSGQNFSDFINNYRVEECKKQLRNPKRINETILAIAFECGFNNKASFNRSFKKITGLTPSEYRSQNVN